MKFVIYHHKRGLVAERGSEVFINKDGERVATPLDAGTDFLKHYKPGEWNHYRIVCKGDAITLFLNGVKMCDIVARDDIDAVIIATSDRWHGTASVWAANAGKDIYCEKGWVEAGDTGQIAYSDNALAGGRTISEVPGIDASQHIREFLDSIKSRRPTACNSSIMRTTEIAGHAAAISWKLGRKLKFDPVKEAFINDDEANALCSYERRAPFTIET